MYMLMSKMGAECIIFDSGLYFYKVLYLEAQVFIWHSSKTAVLSFWVSWFVRLFLLSDIT